MEFLNPEKLTELAPPEYKDVPTKFGPLRVLRLSIDDKIALLNRWSDLTEEMPESEQPTDGTFLQGLVPVLAQCLDSSSETAWTSDAGIRALLALDPFELLNLQEVVFELNGLKRTNEEIEDLVQAAKNE